MPDRLEPPPPPVAIRFRRGAEEVEHLLFEIKKTIVGQERALERIVVCLLARGHVLLEGVPGLAKTLMVETLAGASGGAFSRIQFTPDLMPSDIVGTRIYRASEERFDVELGPIFGNFILADEINRAPAKVQSALLEVMAEGQVTIATKTYQVPTPFLVLATENPIESEGVYPLPEAQQDRFLMKVLLGYPSAQEEIEIVQRMATRPPSVGAVFEPSRLRELQDLADEVYIDNVEIDYAVRLVVATRDPAHHGLAHLAPMIAQGASPRASLALVRAARGLALLRGRGYVLPEDIRECAHEVLRHRLVLSYEALAEDIPSDQLIEELLATVQPTAQEGRMWRLARRGDHH
jgi:MoxR-like ATPase